MHNKHEKIYDKMGDILENKQFEMAFRKNIYYGVVSFLY